MKISIVVPVYNAEKYLEECIESVINQTNPSWELILVNDGSTDKSGEICDVYSKRYPDKIFAFHKKNEGQFLTRKFGILKCTGDYIGFLDSDDILDKNYIRVISKNAEEHNYPDTMCFGFFQFDNINSKELPISNGIKIFRTIDERKAVYEMLISGRMPGSLWSKVFKKEILSANIPCEDFVKTKRFAEDAYHAFDVIAKSQSVLFINQSLYHYRNNAAGFSQGFESRSPDYFNSKFLFESIENNLEIMGINDSESKSKLYKHNFNQTTYFALKYLRAAKTMKRKKEIIDFDWSSYLLEGAIKLIDQENDYRKSYVKVWNAFAKKKYLTIFIREKFKRIIGW